MDGILFINTAIDLITDLYAAGIEFPEDFELPQDLHVYVVWSTKVLKNNKALLSTNVGDGRYFEVTYNGDSQAIYFDSYVKEFNQEIPLSALSEPVEEAPKPKLDLSGD